MADVIIMVKGNREVKCNPADVEGLEALGYSAWEAPKKEKPLDKLNKAELVALVTEKGLEFDEQMTKAELITLLEE